MISELMRNVLMASFVSSMLVALLILCRKMLVQYIGAKWNYRIWFTIFIPWMAIWLPWNFLSAPHSRVNMVIKSLNISLINMTTRVHLSLPKIGMIIWLAGTMGCLLYILLRHFQFILVLKENSRLMKVSEQMAIKEILTNKQQPSLSRMRLSSAVKSPMLCHILKSKIYLPQHFFEDYSATEQKYVIQHELVHLIRYDLLASTATLILVCINWFNPMMFFAYQYFRNAQELSCDAVISQKLSANEKKQYGYALLKTVINQSFPHPLMSCGWNNQKQLKERCQMLQFHHINLVKAFLGIGVLIVAICTATAAPLFEKNGFFQSDLGITFTANKIQSMSHDRMLSGNVQLAIGNNIKIFADKVLVKYNDANHKVDEFTIYGKGTFVMDGHVTQFVNGTFNPNTSQLSAEQIERKS